MRYTKIAFAIAVCVSSLLVSGCMKRITDEFVPIDNIIKSEEPTQAVEPTQMVAFEYDECLGAWYAYANAEESHPLVKMVFGAGETNIITVETTPVNDNPDFSSFKSAEFISDTLAICSDGEWLGTPVRFKLNFNKDDNTCILETIEAATNTKMLENLYLYRVAERPKAATPIPTQKTVATQKPAVTKTKRNEFERKAEDIEAYAKNYLDNAPNQQEINRQSGLVYTKWDDLLNEVYQYLKKNMPSAEFSKLNKDEKAWITKKEKAIDAAEAEWGGGSGAAMARNYEGIRQTRERCYYLISLVEQQ